MKKIFLFLLVCQLFQSCSKNTNNVCWECTIVCGIGGPQSRDTIVCNDGRTVNYLNPKDANGNDCGYSCIKQ